MLCTHPEMHYLLLGNCPGCNPTGYASLFPRSITAEDEEQEVPPAMKGQRAHHDLAELQEQGSSGEN